MTNANEFEDKVNAQNKRGGTLTTPTRSEENVPKISKGLAVHVRLSSLFLNLKDLNTGNSGTHVPYLIKERRIKR